MFDITQFREDIVVPPLSALNIRSPHIVELLVFTCAVESAGGTYVKQVKGPALGIYQIEPKTFTDLWTNYILRKPDIVNMLSLHFSINRIPQPEEVIHDLRLATICTALYYQYKRAIPIDSNIDTLWNLYKKYYNTDLGAAEEVQSIKAYKKFIKA
jgi:hypothetical protein